MSLTGVAQLYGRDTYEQTSAKLFQLGALAYGFGGNKQYRYGRNNGSNAAVAGNLQVAPTVVANHVNRTVAAAAAIGATTVSVNYGATAVTKDFYAGGELVVNDATGESYSYRIKGNDANAGSAAGNVYLEESDPIRVALVASTSEVSLIQNPWDRYVISVTDQADQPIGVAFAAVAVDLYAWVQTRGLCAVLADETLTVGAALTTGTGTAGAVEELDGLLEVQVGIANQAGVDTEERAVFLTID